MTGIEERLRDEIRREGLIPFRRFMEVALYDPEDGYYRRARDPFGRDGDFYTAEQLQPVFGDLMAARIRSLYESMGSPADFTVMELGAGRQEMAPAFAEWRYIPVDLASGALPEHLCGVVFSNEFFDALPVDVIRVGEGEIRELWVGWEAGRFVWQTGERAAEEIQEYVRRYLPAEVSGIVEVSRESLAWLERITRRLEAGYVLSIDYGYTRREAVRFPQGTLMSYRRHIAHENVLEHPGEQDITAHVCFTALAEYGASIGLECVGLETLTQMLLAAGEKDQFASVLTAGRPEEELRRRLQLKNLLFGMGESFRVLLQRRVQK